MKTTSLWTVGLSMLALSLCVTACGQAEPDTTDEITASDEAFVQGEQAALEAELGEEAADIDALIAEEKDEAPLDKAALSKGKVFYLAVLWGNVHKPKKGLLEEGELMAPAEDDSAPLTETTDAAAKPGAPEDADLDDEGKPEKAATQWAGFIGTSAKAGKVVKLIRFEKKTDSVGPCPETDKPCVAFKTITTGGVDGMLLRVTAAPLPDTGTDPASETGEKAAPPKQFVRIVFATHGIDVKIPLHKLPGLMQVVPVGDGQKIAVRGFAKLPKACPHGTLKGKTKALAAGKGGFKGKWVSANGDVTGYLGGVYHKTGDEGGVFKGTYTDADGNKKGVLKGKYKTLPLPVGSKLKAAMAFKGVIVNFAGEKIGVLGGKWSKTGDGTGEIAGKWRAKCGMKVTCDEDPALDPDLECAAENDDETLDIE